MLCLLHSVSASRSELSCVFAFVRPSRFVPTSGPGPACVFELEALGSDKPTLRVLDAGGMARPGVTPRLDETPAAGMSGSGFGIGLVSDAASSPDPEAVFVVCHELLGRLNRRAPRQTLLYVDVNGVALVDAKTARCVSRAAFNELTSWCVVDARVFELKQLGVETRKLESRRFEMPKPGVAAELDAAMRSRVRLYVERPDEVRRLRATAAHSLPRASRRRGVA